MVAMMKTIPHPGGGAQGEETCAPWLRWRCQSLPVTGTALLWMLGQLTLFQKEGGTGTKESEAGGDGGRGYGVGIDTGNRSLPQRDRCHISYL